jgi:hypothetical protein
MQIINKNILTVDKGVICHQVNCKGVMGKGIAKDIRDKWPKVYGAYYRYCKRAEHDFTLLSHCLRVEINDSLIVANIFSQYDYNKKAPFTKHTEYGALDNALAELRGFTFISQMPVYFPHRYGCINGGGDWEVVKKIIDYHLPDAIICRPHS